MIGGIAVALRWRRWLLVIALRGVLMAVSSAQSVLCTELEYEQLTHTPATKNLNVDDTFSLVVYSKVAEMRRGEKRTTTEIQDKANKAG